MSMTTDTPEELTSRGSVRAVGESWARKERR
jgi:hypothetical protein